LPDILPFTFKARPSVQNVTAIGRVFMQLDNATHTSHYVNFYAL